ncbi:cytochrome c oxidase assembly protein [Falsirhodobacter sp. 20TX0035]|uniref:cytochrome c oxidase assembly protein n=1 Tax=Falsirhodobacter sp. 20TX0035 TaxID=3022019 RepID=UPI00232AFA01|nr:cytochrome c oxidase assembly protein [Falsirhodobacter sp. 20TX0035]MDB6454871.1 cytochrome c oxidase assembly protein [Falsirhodobacter sp. 20TX0035]
MKALALLSLVLAWAPPWEAWLGVFPAHMLRHMILVAVSAPLLVLAFPGFGRAMAVPPVLATALEFAMIWGWHLPAAHGAAYRHLPLFVVEQASFLLVGCLIWGACLDRRGPGQALAGAGGLLLTSMHMTLLGALMILAPRDLYAEWCGTVPSVSGQQLGGMIMLAVGTPIYLIGGLWRVSQVLNDGRTA